MQLEEKGILRKNRFNLFKNRNKKEWWYTGIIDQSQNLYLSITYARVDLTDSFRVILFTPENTEPQTISWKGFLDKEIKTNQLYLLHKGKRLSFTYSGSGESGWKFRLSANGWDIDLSINPQTPPFTKYDNFFAKEYTLLHYFQNQVSGTIQHKTKSYTINKGLGYYDHCFGTVPRKTKWHWIAVQNENFALASLMNYGEFAQCYTQCYIQKSKQTEKTNQWIRLNQDASFEYNPKKQWDEPWFVTSPDMEIKLTIINRFQYKERIPPLVPFFIKLDHSDIFIKAEGKVRVDNNWVDTGEMYGVLEEHLGLW